MKVRE
jgi:hypothetical protein